MEIGPSKRRKQNHRIRRLRLNDLPKDVLEHIFNFLPTVDAVRSSLLSRKWRKLQLWRSLSNLDFNYFHFVPKTLKHRSSMNYTGFAKFIDETLKRRFSIPILKFHLRLGLSNYYWQSKVDEWISFAISHKATDLNISFHYHQYIFNFCRLENSHVRDVSLTRCNLRNHCISSWNLDSIRSVCFNHIILTDDMIVDLISRCNNLESLALGYCDGMDRLRISSSTLKKLSLKGQNGESSLKIRCPNLCSLYISDFKVNKYWIKDSTSLVEADVDFPIFDGETIDDLKCWRKILRLFSSVKRLTIQNYVFELLCETKASLDGFVFENLYHLELKTGYGQCDLHGMAALLKVCPHITMLTLRLYDNFNEDFCKKKRVPRKLVDNPIEFSIPKLKILNLKLKNSMGMKIEGLVELMKKHGKALEKIVLWEGNGKRSSIHLKGSS